MHLSKLKWQCRRGTQELDTLLIRYLDTHYLTAPLIEQQHFQQLLAVEDSELLLLFFTEHPENPHAFTYLVEKIRQLATISD